VYHVVVSQTRASDDGTIVGMRVTVDGVERHDRAIALVDDQREHLVDVSAQAKQDRAGS